MTTLGIDFDTKCVHCVLLSDDGEARYVPVPIKDKRGAFEAARNVRGAMAEGFGLSQWLLGTDGWDSVRLVGIESDFHRSHLTKIAQARVQGSIVSCIPRSIEVVALTSHEWKRATVGKAMASKEEVRAWALGVTDLGYCTGCGNHCGDINEGCPVCLAALARLDWPQDAFDAYSIARAVQRLDESARAA